MADKEYVFTTNLAGMEDLLLGEGTVQQIRDGEIKSITKINAYAIPYITNKKVLLDGKPITNVGMALDKLFEGVS